MINFAEELAHLYFRLNGFFLINNYVVHSREYDGKQNADSDLLGIKPKNVTELVGIKEPSNLDKKLQKLFDGADFVGLICEIKGGTGLWKVDNKKILPCIKRLGLFEDEKIVYDNLLKSDHFQLDQNGLVTKVLKIVVSDNRSNGTHKTWHHLTLQEMEEFFLKRLNEFKDKKGSWHFNDSKLFQYIIFKNRELTGEQKL